MAGAILQPNECIGELVAIATAILIQGYTITSSVTVTHLRTPGFFEYNG